MSDGRHYWNRRLGKSLTLSPSSTCLSLSPVSIVLCVLLQASDWKPLSHKIRGCIVSPQHLKPNSCLKSDLWAKSDAKIDTELSVSRAHIKSPYVLKFYVAMAFSQPKLHYNGTNMSMCLILSCFCKECLRKQKFEIFMCSCLCVCLLLDRKTPISEISWSPQAIGLLWNHISSILQF